MVLSNTVVIIHDIPLINTPVIIALCQIVFLLPPRFKRQSSIFFGEKIFQRKEKKKKKKKTTHPHPNMQA